MKTYICKLPVELSRKDFDRINKLFKVDFDDESPEMEAFINELDARPNTNPCTFWWGFEDGSMVVMDINSSEHGYYDEVFIVDKNDGNDYLLESCSGSIDETMIFFDGENNYICKIKILEDK